MSETRHQKIRDLIGNLQGYIKTIDNHSLTAEYRHEVEYLKSSLK